MASGDPLAQHSCQYENKLARIDSVYPGSLSAAIDTLEYFFYECVRRRECANRIGCRCITGEQESLATATAEVARAAIAAPAWFRHPTFIAKPVERWRVLPDPTQRALASARELKPRDHHSGVARQHATRRIDEHLLMSPAIHAGRWVFCIIVGQDEVDT